MSAPRSRWIRNACVPEVITADRHGVTLKIVNGMTGECVKLKLDFCQIDLFHGRVRESAEAQAKELERNAASIRRLVYLPVRKFAVEVKPQP